MSSDKRLSFLKTQFSKIDYYDSQVKNLINLAKDAKLKKYIREDKYVNYPYHVTYVEFLELLKSGEYKNC